MAVFAITNGFCFVGEHDFSTDVNQMTAEFDAEQLSTTTMGDTWDESIMGLKSVSFNMRGFVQSDGSDQVDDVALANLGTSQAMTFGNVQTETEPCFIWQGQNLDYSTFGTVGEVAPFTLSGNGTSGVGAKRGQLALAKTSVSSTGAVGSGVQLGAVAADEYLYATFHIFPTVGTTITIDVESDDNAGFSTATSRGTIGPITTVGGTWMTRVAGAITDDYFRFNVTAVTGTFSAAGAIAVGA